MTEEEKTILINEIVDYLISNSQSVEGIPIVESLDGISSFPAIKDHIDKESDVVRISIDSILPEFRFINGRIQYRFTDKKWIDLFTVSSAMSNYATNDYVILKIDEVIDDKIDKSKIADNLTTADASSVLSSNQGVVLKSFIDDLNEKVFPLSVNIGSDELYKSGTIQNVTLNWTVLKGGTSINPDSQNINNVSIANNLKTFTYNNVTTNTDYNITVEYNGLTASDIKKVEFVNPSYFGILNVDTDITERNIKILTEIIKKTKSYSSSTVTLNNQKSCYAYPKAFGNLTSIKDSNNFEYLNSYSLSELTINNEIYNIYILKDAVSISGFKQTFN